MKKLKMCFLLVLTVLFVNSCQKEEIRKLDLSETQTEPSQLLGNDSPCGEISELCYEPFLEPERRKVMALIGGGGQVDVFVIEPRIGTMEFLLERGGETYVLTNSQDP